jgi:hypothetical protein
MNYRKYNSELDYHIVAEVIRLEGGKKLTTPYKDIGRALLARGVDAQEATRIVEQSMHPNAEWSEDTLALFHDIARAWNAQQWEVRKDGQHRFGPASVNACWIFIHRSSNGNSVEWLMKYEGWQIVPHIVEKR